MRAPAFRRTPARCSLDLVARHPDALCDPTLLGNLVYMVETGGRDLANLLTWALKMLADQPAWLAKLEVETCAGGEVGGSDLAARIIAETLRLEQSESIMRTTRRPLVIGGYHIPAGWLVRICVRESHRDPASFAEPDRFDPDRFKGSWPGSDVYAPLGIGRTACLGRTFVQVAGSTVLQTLARSFTWRDRRRPARVRHLPLDAQQPVQAGGGAASRHVARAAKGSPTYATV